MSRISVQNISTSFSFLKMSGAGNDFVIIDLRQKNFEISQALISKISKRNNIGCDQLIIIRKAGFFQQGFKNTELNTEADCEMQIFNADGSEAMACGNATRCVAKILLDEKFAEAFKIKDQVQKVFIRTRTGLLSAWFSFSKNQRSDLVSKGLNLDFDSSPKYRPKISVDMGEAKILADNLEFFGHKFCHIDVGNPHAIAMISRDLSDDEFFAISPKIENDHFFPNKTNVEFARIITGDRQLKQLNQTSNQNVIEVRVWERGVGETLACGSGACAVGFYALSKGLVSGSSVLIRFKGGDLEISLQYQGSKPKIIMTGEYLTIFRGEFDEDFFSGN